MISNLWRRIPQLKKEPADDVAQATTHCAAAGRVGLGRLPTGLHSHWDPVA